MNSKLAGTTNESNLFWRSGGSEKNRFGLDVSNRILFSSSARLHSPEDEQSILFESTRPLLQKRFYSRDFTHIQIYIYRYSYWILHTMQSFNELIIIHLPGPVIKEFQNKPATSVAFCSWLVIRWLMSSIPRRSKAAWMDSMTPSDGWPSSTWYSAEMPLRFDVFE